MASKGLHPYSQYMVKDGLSLYSTSVHDILIDIKGMYFPVRSINYAKNFNQEPQHGTGTRDPYAIVEHEHTYSGSFTYSSFLIEGDVPIMTNADVLALTKALEDQSDEGKSVYFNIFLLEVPGNRTPEDLSNLWTDDSEAPLIEGNGLTAIPEGATFIEALIDCKLTKSGRTYPEKGTVVTERDFVFSRRIPR